jgi:ATP-binding cassette subfamily B protein
MRPTEKTDPKGALNDLSAYMRRSLGVVILALVLAALSAVLTIIGPDQVGKIATIMSDGLLLQPLQESAYCLPSFTA